MPIRINNRDARRLWLDAQGLATPPVGEPDILPIVRKLGFVQLDTIRVVSRAHHHIIWSRNQHYREPMLNRLLARDRSLFEHFTHDASVFYFGDTWTVGVGVRNLTDQAPPRVDGFKVGSTNNAPRGRGYDIWGRTAFVNIVYNWQ